MNKLIATATILLTLSAGAYAHIIRPVLYESPTDAAEDATPDLNTQAPQPNVTEPQIITNPGSQNQTGNNANTIEQPNSDPNSQQNELNDIDISPSSPGGPYY